MLKYTSLFLFSLLLFYYFKHDSNTQNIKKIQISVKEELKPSPKPLQIKKIIKKRLRLKQLKPKVVIWNKKKRVQKSSSRQDKIIHDSHTSFEDEEGNIYVTEVLLDDGLIIGHGDLILGPESDLESYQNGEKALKLKKPILWPHNTIPYHIQSDLPNKDAIIKVIKWFHKNTNIKFKKYKDQKNHLVFSKGKNHCYANVGMIGGLQRVHLSKACGQKEIFHELIHTLGFLHEQNRMDRDEYVDILWENIEEKNHLQFKKISNKFFDLSSFKFDYNSIMLYGSQFFSRYEGDYSIIKSDGQRISTRPSRPSRQDLIRINEIYQ